MMSIRRDKLEIGISARNLFNERANLGDLNNMACSKFDETGQIIPQVVVL
jgi:hypothetical protein